MIWSAALRGRHNARERGAATLLVVSASGLLLFVGLALSGVSALVVAHRRAQSAADLAALAGAVAAADARDACAAATLTARANEAELVACSRSGTEVRVTVIVSGIAVPGGRPLDLRAEARAGAHADSPRSGNSPLRSLPSLTRPSYLVPLTHEGGSR